jgi:hypothetical protein
MSAVKAFMVPVVALLAVARVDPVAAAEQDVRELLAKVDVSDPRFGTRTFGAPRTDRFEDAHGAVLLAHQARFGGDGDHTENRLKVFRFTGEVPAKVLDQDLEAVAFVEAGGALREIRGNVVESLCDVCDGWDVADRRDLFFIPVVIDARTFAVTPALDRGARRRLLQKLRARARANVAEHARQGNSAYATFAAAVVGRVEALLSVP